MAIIRGHEGPLGHDVVVYKNAFNANFVVPASRVALESRNQGPSIIGTNEQMRAEVRGTRKYLRDLGARGVRGVLVSEPGVDLRTGLAYAVVAERRAKRQTQAELAAVCVLPDRRGLNLLSLVAVHAAMSTFEPDTPLVDPDNINAVGVLLHGGYEGEMPVIPIGRPGFRDQGDPVPRQATSSPELLMPPTVGDLRATIETIFAQSPHRIEATSL